MMMEIPLHEMDVVNSVTLNNQTNVQENDEGITVMQMLPVLTPIVALNVRATHDTLEMV